MRKANPTAQIQDMPEVAVDLITIVKMVSKLGPRVELMRSSGKVLRGILVCLVRVCLR